VIAKTAHLADSQQMTSDGPAVGEALVRFHSQDADAPLQVLTYRLTTTDVAAWIGSRRAERRAGRALVASALLAGAMGLQVLSGRLPVPPGRAFAIAEAAMILILPVVLALWTRRRSHLAEAGRDLPAAIDARLEVWPDRLVLTEAAGKPQVIKPRLLHRLSVTRHHILGETDSARLILPLSAFADHAGMRAFANHLLAQRG
jgi:hypothetical protein